MDAEKDVVRVMDRPLAANVCNQQLRELMVTGWLSWTHVTMAHGETSLRHKHNSFTEFYYFLGGEGILEVGSEKIAAKVDTLVRIPPGTGHRLINIGETELVHLVVSTPPFNPNDVEVM